MIVAGMGRARQGVSRDPPQGARSAGSRAWRSREGRSRSELSASRGVMPANAAATAQATPSSAARDSTPRRLPLRSSRRRRHSWYLGCRAQKAASAPGARPGWLQLVGAQHDQHLHDSSGLLFRWLQKVLHHRCSIIPHLTRFAAPTSSQASSKSLRRKMRSECSCSPPNEGCISTSHCHEGFPPLNGSTHWQSPQRSHACVVSMQVRISDVCMTSIGIIMRQETESCTAGTDAPC